MKKSILLTLLIFCTLSCASNIELLDPIEFQTTIDGKQVDLFTIRNKKGMVSQITNYGGRVISLWVSDRNRVFDDVVLGYPLLRLYTNSDERYFGALIGRYGNRIENGKFSLLDKEYNLAKNNDKNHLHGGNKGFNQVVWDAKKINESTLELRYLSPDGEEGYPGNLDIKVVYTLTEENALKIEYEASTDKITPVNLTHHSYFNLKGAGEGNVRNHFLQINADTFTPVDEGLIPTGEIRPVEGTQFDFRNSRLIGYHLDAPQEQLQLGLGYDHNYIINGSGLRFAAKVEEYITGRTMEVWTDEPGLQFYSGNHLDGMNIGKKERHYHHFGAICLEAQHFPNSPNEESFPSTLLYPGELYTSTCIYKFGIIKRGKDYVN